MINETHLPTKVGLLSRGDFLSTLRVLCDKKLVLFIAKK